MAVNLRGDKGSALTYDELDANFEAIGMDHGDAAAASSLTCSKVGKNKTKNYIEFLDGNADPDAGYNNIKFYINGQNDMELDYAGNLQVEQDVIAYSVEVSSDEKLKDNITNVENALDKVQQLNGVEFTWKKNGEKSAGVIAQDVEKVLPQAVKEAKDLKTEEPYKTVNYDALHAILIESIKELKAEIDELKKNK